MSLDDEDRDFHDLSNLQVDGIFILLKHVLHIWEFLTLLYGVLMAMVELLEVLGQPTTIHDVWTI